MTNNNDPYDEKNVRSHGFAAYVRIHPDPKDASRKFVTLSVPDGPETFASCGSPFESNADGESNLTDAIEVAVNKMISLAREQEAGRWIEDHDKVYLVQGQTGKLADGPTGKDRWTVKAFASEERAHDLMRTLNHWCCQVGVARVCYEDPMRRMIIDPEGLVAKCPHDSGFRVDETGVLYTIGEAPLDMFNPVREG